MAELMFRYIGGGMYRVGLPTRDLYRSDMARAEKQGWPEERIDELVGLYERVEPEPEPEPEIIEDDGLDDVEEEDDALSILEA